MPFVVKKRTTEQAPTRGSFTVRVPSEARAVSGPEAQLARVQQRTAEGLTTAAQEAPILAANVSRGAKTGLLGMADAIGEGVKAALLTVVDPSGIRREVNPVFQEFERASVSKLTGEPEAPIRGTISRDIATRAGQEMGVTALPSAGVLNLARMGVNVPVSQFAARRPGTFTAGEMTAAASAGAGSELVGGEQAGPAISLLGEAVGGVTPFAFASTLENMFRAVFQRSKGKAAAKAQLATRDPETAAQLLREDVPEGMTSAQASGDPGLLSLERSMVRSHDRMRNQFLESQQRLNQSMIDEVEDVLKPSGAGIEVAQQFSQGRIDRARDVLNERAVQASEAVKQRIERLGAGANEVQAQAIVQDELERFYQDARAQEREFWDNVPRDVTVSRADAAKTFRDRFADEEPDNIALLPSGVRELFRARQGSAAMQALTGEGPRALPDIRVGRLQSLRSSVLETAREARRASQFNKARVHEMAADALFDMMVRNEAAGGPITAATQFSRGLNEKFTSGPVADILGLSRGQTRPTTREQPLARPLRGPEAGANVDAIRRAAQNPNSELGLADSVLAKFQNEVAIPKGDKLNVDHLRKWRHDNRALLSRFPEIDKALETTEGAQLLADRRLNELGQFDKSVAQAQHGRLRRFLSADPDRAIAVTMGGDQPARFTRELVKMSKDDPTGNAFKGLQRGYFDDLMRNVINDNGNITLAAWNRYLSPRRKSALREVYTPTQMRALENIKHELQRAQRSAQRLPGGSDTIENASLLTTTLFRLTGAGLLRRVSNTLQGPAFGAQLGANMARALENPRKAMLLLERAVMEPKVMADLLTTRTRRDPKWENRINGYLLDLETQEPEEESMLMANEG